MTPCFMNDDRPYKRFFLHPVARFAFVLRACRRGVAGTCCTCGIIFIRTGKDIYLPMGHTSTLSRGPSVGMVGRCLSSKPAVLPLLLLDMLRMCPWDLSADMLRQFHLLIALIISSPVTPYASIRAFRQTACMKQHINIPCPLPHHSTQWPVRSGYVAVVIIGQGVLFPCHRNILHGLISSCHILFPSYFPPFPDFYACTYFHSILIKVFLEISYK